MTPVKKAPEFFCKGEDFDGIPLFAFVRDDPSTPFLDDFDGRDSLNSVAKREIEHRRRRERI